MKKVILNAGNSWVRMWAWGGADDLPCSENGTLLERTPLQALGDVATAELLSGDADSLDELAAVLVRWKDFPLAVVSVVPEVGDIVRGTRPDVWFVDGHGTLPYSHDIPDIHAVGPDRLCNAAAVVAAGLPDALVVDAGTATTFDLILGGVFRGGLIAPGVGFAAEQLGRRAALLKPVPLAPCPLEVGLDTARAMATGSWHVGIQGIEGVVQGLLDRYGTVPVVLTGGWGPRLAAAGRHIDQNWTARGAGYLSGLRDLRS